LNFRAEPPVLARRAGIFLTKVQPRGILISAAILKATGKLREEGWTRTRVGEKGENAYQQSR